MSGSSTVRHAEDLRLLEKLPEILTSIDSLFAPANTWLCGICGCLCKIGEVCPKCRGDLLLDAGVVR